MLKDVFQSKKDNKPPIKPHVTSHAANIPDQMWVACPGCGRMIYDKLYAQHLKVCPMCGYHIPMNAVERIEMIFDANSFQKFEYNIPVSDPLNFPDYKEKLNVYKNKTGCDEAVVCGIGEISGLKTVTCVMDNAFMMASMGYVVGESITRAVEYATENNLPIIIFATSGGARMQEGIVSLMQMAKISGAIKRHAEKRLLYVTVITHPTTGGVTASFASLGDIIIAETGALIGFAGKRVIEQTIKQKLPKNFQTAEFSMLHGFVDHITPRKKLNELLYHVLLMHQK